MGMHPAAGGEEGASHADFMLEGKWATLEGTVAINDNNNIFGWTGGVVFVIQEITPRIRPLWSAKLFGTNEQQAFTLDVKDVQHLRLMVYAEGTHAFAHAVWVDPVLKRRGPADLALLHQKDYYQKAKPGVWHNGVHAGHNQGGGVVVTDEYEADNFPARFWLPEEYEYVDRS